VPRRPSICEAAGDRSVLRASCVSRSPRESWSARGSPRGAGRRARAISARTPSTATSSSAFRTRSTPQVLLPRRCWVADDASRERWTATARQPSREACAPRWATPISSTRREQLNRRIETGLEAVCRRPRYRTNLATCARAGRGRSDRSVVLSSTGPHHPRGSVPDPHHSGRMLAPRVRALDRRSAPTRSISTPIG